MSINRKTILPRPKDHGEESYGSRLDAIVHDLHSDIDAATTELKRESQKLPALQKQMEEVQRNQAAIYNELARQSAPVQITEITKNHIEGVARRFLSEHEGQEIRRGIETWMDLHLIRKVVGVIDNSTRLATASELDRLKDELRNAKNDGQARYDNIFGRFITVWVLFIFSLIAHGIVFYQIF